MGKSRLLITAVIALLLVLPASVVVAQDESPAPDPAVALAGTDFEGVFPTELGGLPWDDLTVNVGAEHLSDQDEDGLAETEALLESLGATIDDVTTVSASRISEDFNQFAFVVAFRVSGVDVDRLLEEFLRAFAADLSEPRQETGQVAGKDVVLLHDDAFTEATGEAQPFHFYLSEDTLWMVTAPEPELTEAFEKLP
jgi:hypothetical protein